MFNFDLEDLVCTVVLSIGCMLIGMVMGTVIGTEYYSDAVRCKESTLGYRTGHCGACFIREMQYAKSEK